MYKLSVEPKDVIKELSTHILADGYDITYDMEKSEGAYIYDSKNDRKLLDFFTCFASVPLGYNHPKMVNDENFKKNLLLAAIANPSNSDVYTQQYAEFVKTFASVGIPKYLPHAFFVAGGALAVENAIKVAMDWKVQKNFEKGHKEEKGFKVLHFEKSFHGRSGYTLSLTNTLPDKTKWFAKFDWPRIPVPTVQFPLEGTNLDKAIQTENNAIELIKKAFQDNPDDICSILIEPIQSEGGDNHIREEFLIQLKQIADQNDAMLIYDEVQTGVGLTGKFWAHEHFSEAARPDIISFGKKMQICGILVGTKVDEIPGNVFNVSSRINSTWGGNLVDMVRSTQILNIIKEDNLCEKATETGEYLKNQLHELASKYPIITNVRGRGLLCAFDLPSKAQRDEFVKLGMENNVMFLGCGNQSIRFRPSLCIEKHHIDEGVEKMKLILSAL